MKLNLDNLNIYFRTKKGTKWLVFDYSNCSSFTGVIDKMLERDYDFKIEYITQKMYKLNPQGNKNHWSHNYINLKEEKDER